MGTVRVYKPNTQTGEVKVTGEIPLGSANAYGAMAHYAVWLTDRYAYIGTMQQGPTSATKPGSTVIEPSVWLIDVQDMKATRVIGTQHGQLPGLLRSPSDVALAHGKLYVAEEDSWGRKPNAPASDYGRDGYVSIWDVSNPAAPKFIKRLAPGQGLPADFRNAHTASATLDGDFVYVSSFISNHLVKIDTATDTVTKVYSMDQGLMMFHGEYAAGRNR
jgi:DNA-binding beta-propeller fold protein YncE